LNELFKVFVEMQHAESLPLAMLNIGTHSTFFGTLLFQREGVGLNSNAWFYLTSNIP
jgi:hypothetical protein